MQFLGRDERLFLAEDVANVVRTGFKAFILLVVVSMQREIGFEHDKLQSHEPEPFAIAGPDGPVDLVIQGFSVEEVPVPFNADGLRDLPRPLIEPFPLPLGVPVVFLPFDVAQDLLSHEGMEQARLLGVKFQTIKVRQLVFDGVPLALRIVLPPFRHHSFRVHDAGHHESCDSDVVDTQQEHPRLVLARHRVHGGVGDVDTHEHAAGHGQHAAHGRGSHGRTSSGAIRPRSPTPPMPRASISRESLRQK